MQYLCSIGSRVVGSKIDFIGEIGELIGVEKVVKFEQPAVENGSSPVIFGL